MRVRRDPGRQPPTRLTRAVERSTETMFDITRKEMTWGGRPLILESGRLARQADGAVLATYGTLSFVAE